MAHKIAENQRQSGRVKQGERCHITCGVDGTVYKKHPTFADLMDQMTRQLCDDSNIEVEFALSYDGSGKGAALVTAVADRLLKVCRLIEALFCFFDYLIYSVKCFF